MTLPVLSSAESASGFHSVASTPLLAQIFHPDLSARTMKRETRRDGRRVSGRHLTCIQSQDPGLFWKSPALSSVVLMGLGVTCSVPPPRGTHGRFFLERQTGCDFGLGFLVLLFPEPGKFPRFGELPRILFLFLPWPVVVGDVCTKEARRWRRERRQQWRCDERG